jgi:hypothetical protein
MTAKTKAPKTIKQVSKKAKGIKGKRILRNQPAPDKGKRLSALDAAARVLTETKQALSCFDLITAMSAKGYWTSPGGKTPQATLAAAIQREIAVKKQQSRFQKTAPGRFALA